MRALEEVLLDLTLKVWRRADAATPAEHHLVAARDVYDAANAIIASSLTDLGHVRFFERTSWEIELPGYRMDAFRDDGLHWRLVLDVLDEHVRTGRDPGRPLRPLDLYGAEELTETVSNYAAPLLVLAARGPERVDGEAIRQTHEAVLTAVAGRGPVEAAPAPVTSPPSASRPTLRFVDVIAKVGVQPFDRPAVLVDARAWPTSPGRAPRHLPDQHPRHELPGPLCAAARTDRVGGVGGGHLPGAQSPGEPALPGHRRPLRGRSGPLHRGAQMGWGWNGFFLDADNDGDEDLWSPMGSDPSRCRPRRGRGCRSPSRSCQPPSERPTCGRRC